MKKIITSSLFVAIGAFTNLVSAQQLSDAQHIAIQSDDVAQFKNAYPKAEYNKCYGVKEFSYTPLAYGAIHERKNIVKYLINNRADVNKACDGVTPLMNVAMYGNTEMIKLLLANGASKTAKDNNNQTARDYALKNNHKAAADLLK